MSNGIEDKVVVITGASTGLGEATARLLSEQGASVVLGARRADRIEALAHPLGQTLIVTSGLGRAQREGGAIEEIRPGTLSGSRPARSTGMARLRRRG